MKNRYFLLFLLALLASLTLPAQTILPRQTVCIPFGEGYIIDAITPDELDPSEDWFVDPFTTGCVDIDDRGRLFFSAEAQERTCCGDTTNFEIYALVGDPTNPSSAQTILIQPVELIIKCPKPDCGLVGLEFNDGGRADDGQGEPEPCLSACENSVATYTFPYTNTYDYDWSATGGSAVYDPAVPGQVQITWGAAGNGNFSVVVTDQNNGNTVATHEFCVDINDSPEADFSFDNTACLNQPVSFTNLTTGPSATYTWDFGDGTILQGVANPTHEYASPGSYVVTLSATSDNYDPRSDSGCCCTDKISYPITIDSLPGPGVFWISTLCEGDTSRYWTDAAGCSSYNWSVAGGGTIVAGAGTDTISVVWGSGPAGQISLGVTGCPTTYCTDPTVVNVPIISAFEMIDGPEEVCPGESANYTLPKWGTVSYNWSTTGGVITSGQGGNGVNITWPTTPGTYTINVTYGSDFLAGLPGHEGADCTGTSTKTVTVLGDFTAQASPNPGCAGGNSTLFVNSTLTGTPGVSWTATGPATLSATGNFFTANWPAPGTYTVTAAIDNPAAYCSPTKTFTVLVEEAIEPTISGPTAYCAGDTLSYSVDAPAPGYNYFWTATNGSVVAGQGSATVSVVFTASGGTLSAQGFDTSSPFCSSDPVTVSPGTIVFNGNPQIVGPPACTNERKTYTIDLPQDASATYAWSVIPASAGSVIAGADLASATVQWNAAAVSAQVQVVVTVCKEARTLVQSYVVQAPTQPDITMSGVLCNGSSATLGTSVGFSGYEWSTGATTPMITATSPGNYRVTTTDANGCSAVDQEFVSANGGPSLGITATGRREGCLGGTPLDTVTFYAITGGGGGLTYEWFQDGVSQGAPSATQDTFVYVWTTTPGTISFYVEATDANGCTVASDLMYVRQRDCQFGCPQDGVDRSHTFTATRQSPNCGTVDLSASFNAGLSDSHSFYIDGNFTSISTSGSFASGAKTRQVALREVGCIRITSILIYTTASGVQCYEELEEDVCNPLLADFDFVDSCGTVTFINKTKTAPSLLSGPVTYSYNFGDGNTGSGPNSMHAYAVNGTYTVTLTVSDGSCTSTFTDDVTVSNLATAGFTVAPGTVCAGEVATFTSTGSGEVYWVWGFGDTTQLITEVGSKTYFPNTTTIYDVSLLVTNSAGCSDSTTMPITVNPAPPADTIRADNGLLLCDGESTTLFLTGDPGYNYIWSNSQTGQAITVDAAGDYAVTVTDPNGCSTYPAPVTVQVIPLPDASARGDLVICGSLGETTLTANAGGGHRFIWENLTVPNVDSSSASYTVGYSGLGIQEVQLTVRNLTYGCTSTHIFQITEAPLPIVDITLSGTGCAGSLNELSVTSPEPDVVYTWSTGGMGTTISTTLAGLYTVVATNQITGCSANAYALINPLPDVCAVPTGCYEACAPDTLSGPVGNYNYTWLLDGAVVGTQIDLIASTSGEYQLYVENAGTGCGVLTESLFLEIIDCSTPPPGGDCDDLMVTVERSSQADGKGCCYELYYTDLPVGAYYLEISSDDADLSILPGSVNSDFGFSSVTGTGVIQLATDALLSAPLPSDVSGPSALVFCPSAVTNTPQTVVITFYDADGKVVCKKQVETDCEKLRDCAFIADQEAVCGEGKVAILTVTVCVPLDSEFPVGYVQLRPTSLAASAVLPQSFPFSPALQPGQCTQLTIPLPGVEPGAEFCYQLVAHSADPNSDPTALCCSESEEFCVEVPDCDPCDDVSVKVDALEDCCYQIVASNGAPGYGFDGLLVTLPAGFGANLTVANEIGLDLVGTAAADGQSVTFTATDGGALPGGLLTLPSLCLEGASQPITVITVQWLRDGEADCPTELELFCEPECGYLLEEEVVCEGPVYQWNGTVTNTSDHDISSVYVDFPAPFDAYDRDIILGSALTPGSSTSISLAIGAPAAPNQEICVTVVLHETADDEDHLNCCRFETCLTMPDCERQGCDCESFDGTPTITTTALLTNDRRTYAFQTDFDLGPCDELVWQYRGRGQSWQPMGSGNPQTFTFPTGGQYIVWLLINRLDDDGRTCQRTQAIQRLTVPNGPVADDKAAPSLFAYPNPASQEVFIDIDDAGVAELGREVQLLDSWGRVARTYPADRVDPLAQTLRLNLAGLKPGAYTVRVQVGKRVLAKRVVKR